MTNHAPTTRNVRYLWNSRCGNPEEFDRWLAEHDAKVWDEGNLAAWNDGEEAENPYREGNR